MEFSYRVRVVRQVEEVLRVDLETEDMELGRVEAVLAVYNQLEEKKNSRDVKRLNVVSSNTTYVEDVGDAEVVLPDDA